MNLVDISYCFAICVASIFYQSNAHCVYDETVASNYNFSAWCSSVRTNYNCTVANLDMGCFSLPTNGISCRASQSSFKGCFKFNLVDSQSNPILEVQAMVGTNVWTAHSFIINRFSRMSSPVKWLAYTNNLGDVAFYYPLMSNFNSLIFSRNNICVKVRSSVDYLSATNVAHQIDADILSKSLGD